MIWLQTGTDNFVPQDSGMIVSCCFLGFIHLIPPLTRDLSQESSFCAFFASQCFIDLSVIFYLATHPCFIDLSLIWIWNWCRVEWHSSYSPWKQSQELKSFWEKGRTDESESPLALQVSSESISSGYLLPRDFELFLACKNLPREFCILGTDQIIGRFRLVSPCLPPIVVAYLW